MRPGERAVTTHQPIRSVPIVRPTTVSLPYEPQSASAARRLVRDVLADWELEHLSDDAELVVTELVSNATKTGCRTSMLVSAARVDNRAGRVVRFAVRDGSRTLPVLIPRATGDSGRGLALVDHLAAFWGVDMEPHGKTIWADLRVDRT
nr:ATP-binding protein [Streptomyces sp. SID5473]